MSRFTTSDVRAALIADSNLTALVGTRIYRGKLPDNPIYPLIMYRASEEPENLLTGASYLVHKLYEFELYGVDYVALEQIAQQLKTTLLSDTTFKATLTDVTDDAYQDDTKVFSIFLDFSIWQ